MIYVNNDEEIIVPTNPITLNTVDDADLIFSLKTDLILTFICEPVRSSPLTSSSLTLTVASPNLSGSNVCQATVPSLSKADIIARIS